jgi:hypothetical protein
MDIEGKIRSRIEAILVNDARNYAEMRMMATEEDPIEQDLFAEERNLYQRIINSYRNAVSEVNSLLEENISFLSGFCRIVQTIKDKSHFQEICSQIISCVLQDLGAEYCGLVFHSQNGCDGDVRYLEGIKEQRKFLCTHSQATLLGSPEFERVISRLAEEEESDFVNIGDVYREPRFNSIDFPGVVRSLVCLPLRTQGTKVGALVLSHSLPHFFTPNHARMFRILAATISHIWLLTAERASSSPLPQVPAPTPDAAEDGDTTSIVLLSFEALEPVPGLLTSSELLRSVLYPISRTLRGKEIILRYGEEELLILLPGLSAEQLSARVTGIQQAWEDWKSGQGEAARRIQVNLGYATCEEGEDLTRTLEVAALMMNTHQDESDLNPAPSQPHG